MRLHAAFIAHLRSDEDETLLIRLSLSFHAATLRYSGLELQTPRGEASDSQYEGRWHR
jgi:hypothetical protein